MSLKTLTLISTIYVLFFGKSYYFSFLSSVIRFPEAKSKAQAAFVEVERNSTTLVLQSNNCQLKSSWIFLSWKIFSFERYFCPVPKMLLNHEHFRALIFYNCQRGLTQQRCMDELNSIFGDEATTTSVYR